MFGLIVRGAHNSDKPQKRTDTAELIRTNFYDEFASDFNKALSGKYNYRADIDKQEIIQMLDSLMAQRVNVIGKGSLAERQKVSRITRSLRLAWDRVPSRDYNGSMAEWNSGRKERVIKADLIRRGLVPAEEQAEPGNKRAAGQSWLHLHVAFPTNILEPNPSRSQEPALSMGILVFQDQLPLLTLASTRLVSAKSSLLQI
jgi:hypothetical protein